MLGSFKKIHNQYFSYKGNVEYFGLHVLEYCFDIKKCKLIF